MAGDYRHSERERERVRVRIKDLTYQWQIKYMETINL